MSDDVHKLHHAVQIIMRAFKIAETNVQVAHRELAFGPPEIQTMRFVAEHMGCKLAELAEHLAVVPTTASSIVDRLVERGFIRRDRPETNRRAIAVAVTEAGEKAFSRIEAEELVTMQMMLDALSEDERASFVKSISKIAASVSSQ